MSKILGVVAYAKEITTTRFLVCTQNLRYLRVFFGKNHETEKANTQKMKKMNFPRTLTFHVKKVPVTAIAGEFTATRFLCWNLKLNLEGNQYEAKLCTDYWKSFASVCSWFLSLNMFKFCQNDQRTQKENKGSLLVVEFNYNSQNTQLAS